MYVLAYALEALTLILGFVRSQDSSTKCHRRDDFQMACSVDPECPPCTSMQLSVEGLDALHILALIAELLVGMMPHRATDESARVHIIRTRGYGHFHIGNLDRNIFRDRRGNF